MSIRLGLAVGLFALAFNIHAGVVPKPIAQQLPIEIVQAQQEVAIDVPTTASAVGMQFGLIGALIGSAVQNSQAKGAEERVIPIRDSLVGYDFNNRLEQALRAKLASSDVSPEPQFTLWTPVALAERQTGRLEQPAQALVIAPRYAFDYELDTFTVRAVVTLESRERKSSGKYKVRSQFRRTYAFSFPIDKPTKSAQPWVALGRAGLAAMMDQGITQVTDMIAYDFSDQGRSEWDRDNRKQFVRIKDHGYPGMPVRQEADFVWARTGKFDAQTLQGWQPLSGSIAITPLPSTATVAPVAAADVSVMPAAIGAEPVMQAEEATKAGGEVPAGSPLGQAPAAVDAVPVGETPVTQPAVVQ